MEAKRYCACHQVGVALLTGQLLLAGSLPAGVALAAAEADQQPCSAQVSQEHSIVVAEKQLSEGAFVTPTQRDGGLEPIAQVLGNVPELADPLPQPTPAEPLVAQRERHSSRPRLTEAERNAAEEVISFHGITPGLSSRADVLQKWGDPRSNDTQAARLRYRFDDLPTVQVQLEDNRVTSIEVELQKLMPIATLTRKLNLSQVRPASLVDAEGDTIGQVYPERGVILHFSGNGLDLAIASDKLEVGASQPRVGSITIQPVEASSFLLRAAESSTNHFTHAIADLKAALRLDGSLAGAHNQLSEIYLRAGHGVTAEHHAAEAVDLDASDVVYRLQWAECLRQLARYDRAVEQVRKVLETPNIAPLSRAQALNEMGLLASLGSRKVARRAVPLHAKAIDIADGLAVSDDWQVSTAAKALLVKAHLAVAVEISRGAWEQKDEAVPEWIERASALSEALIDEEPAYLPLRLEVAVSSLAAAANLEKPINPLLWIEEAEETTAEIKAEIFDPLTVGQFDWQLGLAYFHGSQIEHRRSQPDSAIHLAELADQHLMPLAKVRDEMPDTSYLLGRLYFQMGAVYAVHHDDHQSACEWYDVAVDRLLNPVPVTTMAAPQQHGDALVSMGVSYWHQGDHQRAIEVTKSGVELIETAVASGLLERDTLKVSYNNLAAMYEAEGDQEPAARYEMLAKQITGSKVTQKQAPRENQRR